MRMSRIWLVLGLVLATTGAVTIFVERKATVRVCHAHVRIAGDDLHASARHTLVCFAADLERGRVSRLMAQEPTGYEGNPLPPEARTGGSGGIELLVDPIVDAYSWRPLTVKMSNGRTWQAVLIGVEGTDSWGLAWGPDHGPPVPVSTPG